MAIYNEFNPFAAQWLRNLVAGGHIALGTVDARDIREVVPSDVREATQFHAFAGIGGWSLALRLAGWPDDVGVWTGSCPCQPFSEAGRRTGFDDERHLWPEWFRLIRECRPVTIFGEQVASSDGLRWLDVVSTDLEGAGYAFGAADLCAASVGAPHKRQRLFFVADAGGDECGKRRAGKKDERPLESSGRSETRVMGHAPNGENRAFAGQPDKGRATPITTGGPSFSGELGHASGTGLEGRSGKRGDHGEERASVERAGGAVHGFWSDAEWIPCIDGGARPIEPDTFPLVDGAAYRVGSGSTLEGKSRIGMISGYGNAIVPQVAATFIRAFMERN